MGYVNVMWLETCKFFTYGQLLLSGFVGFMKPDFLTLSAVVIALYYFKYPDSLRKRGFKELTSMIMISIVYDLIWIFFITDFGDPDSSSDRREATVQLFSLRLCYVSLVWRVSIIFW